MKKAYKLPLFITFCHLPILFIQIHHAKKKNPPRKKIIINTINLLEEKPFVAYQQEAKTSIAKKPSFKPKAKPKLKKAPSKKIVKKVKSKPTKKIAKKKIQKAINKSLNKTKIATKTNKNKNLKTKKSTKKDAGKAQSEYNLYLSMVSDLLAEALTLPEKGRVKLKLTIRPNGKVAKIVTLLSESNDNLAYLQTNLSTLSFPAYKKQEDRTFTIVFSDEK